MTITRWDRCRPKGSSWGGGVAFGVGAVSILFLLLVAAIISPCLRPIEFQLGTEHLTLFTYRAGSTGVSTLDRVPAGFSYRSNPFDPAYGDPRRNYLRLGDLVYVVERVSNLGGCRG